MQTIEKHMDTFTREDLHNLLEDRPGPCVSLYMPTEKQSPETQQNPIRFKNLVNRTRELLKESDMKADQINNLLRPLEPILDDPTLDYWQYMSKGMAVFLTPDAYLSYRLPHAFNEMAYVGDHFHIRQILPLTADGDRFYLLALDQGGVHLLRGNRYQIGEVDTGEMPTSLAEVLRFDDFERQLQLHSTSGKVEKQGQSDFMYHGHGTAGDEATQRENLLRFMKALDNGICELLDTERTPLILAGTDALRGYYRQANNYRNLLKEDIDTHPEGLNERELHHRAWAIIEPRTRKAYHEAVDLYHQLEGNQPERAASSLETIVPAACFKRVDTLFIPSGVQCWGRYDSVNDELVEHEERQAGDQDLFNEAALYTVAYGGTVYSTDPDTIPTDTGQAAILRF